MAISHVTAAISSVSLLSVLAFSLPTYASSDDAATNLLPLESRSIIIVEVDPDLYQSAAYKINIFAPEQADSSDLADALGAGFLEDLVDENGEVNLPLGITVFDAMGTTSVGFGSDF